MKNLSLLFTILFIFWGSISSFGQDTIKQLTIRINALLPSSNFGNDDIEDWIFDGGGGATAGFGAGLQYLIPLENPSFGVFLSGDLFINNTKNKIKEDWEDIFASKQNVKYPKYINIPILAGFNYNYKKENSSIGFFGNTGLGFNYLKITNFSTSSDGDGLEFEFDKSIKFAYEISGGAVFNDKVKLALSFINLGNHDIDGTETDKYANGNKEKYDISREYDPSNLDISGFKISIGLILH